MTKQIINIGRTANDRSGDPLRVAFDKVNQNFTELYSAVGADTAANELVNGAYTISLESTGVLTMPVGGTINNTSENSPATGTIYTFVNDGTDIPGIANSNIVYLDNTVDAQTIQAGWIITFANATQKTVMAADIGLSPNAGKRMLTFVGNVSLTSAEAWPLTVQSADYSSGVNITKLEITPEGTTTWTFDSEGIIKLPVGGDIVNSSGVSVLSVINGGNASTTF